MRTVYPNQSPSYSRFEDTKVFGKESKLKSEDTMHITHRLVSVFMQVSPSKHLKLLHEFIRRRGGVLNS